MAGAAFTACSPAEVFGPRPDPELVQLAQQAEADAAAADGEVAALREEHAAELYTEIARLCGLDESGAPPSSCAVDDPDPAPEASPVPLGRYLEVVDDVPEQSRDLVVDQAIDLAVLDSSEAPATAVDEDDHGLVAKMIEREHAAVYGLKSARAFASEPAGVDELVERHQARLLSAQQTIPDPPVAAAGYTGADVSAGDEFIRTEEDNLIAAWRAAAADSTTEQGRALLIAGAADAIDAYREYP